MDGAALVRRLHERAEHAIAEVRLVERANHELDAERLRPGAQDVDGLRKAGIRDKKLRWSHDGINAPGLHAMQHRHRLGGRSGLVEQRRVRDFHSGEVADHGLEIQEALEPALSNLSLIRRVRRIPAGILEDVSENHARRHAVVIAQSDVRSENLIAGRDVAQVAKVSVFGLAVRQIERFGQSNPRRNRFVDERVERRGANDLEHLVAFSFVGSYVAGLETFGVEKHRH